MRKLFAVALLCGTYTAVSAQNTLDNYFTSTNTYTEVGNSSNSLTAPHDIDFVPGRPNEFWVLNKEANGGSVVIFFNAGQPNQFSQFRRDSHNDHFMARAVAIAMGENNEFVSAQEIKNTASSSSTFMGPALWSSDTSIFARLHQNNWVVGQLLGSHIDMLHQSPFGMGVAYDHTRVYWYFDGHNGNICKYDFAIPHGVGEDDHADGKIHRYTDVTVTRKPNMPSHMALDKANNWLYIVDGGANRVIRMKTNTGTVGANLSVPATGGEPLAEYKAVTGATVEVLISSGLTAPCGIDYRNGRLIVSDNANGNILMYDVTTSTPQLKGTFNTGAAGVMGVRIDNNNKIWFVNNTTQKLMRIDNPNVVSITEMEEEISYFIYPNPASDNLNLFLQDASSAAPIQIAVTNIAGEQIYKMTAREKQTTINTSSWAKGLYMVNMMCNGKAVTEKVLIQ